MRKIQKIIDHFFKNKTNKVLFIATIVFAVLFFVLFKKAFIVFLFIFISWITKSYQKHVNIYLGIDFIMVATILPAFVYDPFTGAFSGVISMLLSSLWRGRFNMVVFLAYILLIICAYITPLIASLIGITKTGILITVIYDLIIGYFSIVILHGRIERAVTFTVTHIGFNTLLFTLVVPKLLVIM